MHLIRCWRQPGRIGWEGWRCGWELDVGGELLHIGSMVVAHHLTNGGNFLWEVLESYVLLGALALQGRECIGERGKAICIIFHVAGAVIANILHRGAIAVKFGIFFNPKTFEFMSLDQG